MYDVYINGDGGGGESNDGTFARERAMLMVHGGREGVGVKKK